MEDRGWPGELRYLVIRWDNGEEEVVPFNWELFVWAVRISSVKEVRVVKEGGVLTSFNGRSLLFARYVAEGLLQAHMNGGLTFENFQRHVIAEALKGAEYDKDVAELLGMTQRALSYWKVEKLGLPKRSNNAKKEPRGGDDGGKLSRGGQRLQDTPSVWEHVRKLHDSLR